MAENEIDTTVELDPTPEPSAEDTQQATGDDGEPVETEATEAVGDEEEGEPAEPEPELVEYDLGEGVKFKAPPQVKDFILRQSDYTRKTTEVAEDRKALEAEREALAAERQADQAHALAVARLADVDHQLANFGRGPDGNPVSAAEVDWASWQQSNPQQAQQGLMRVQALEQQRINLTRAVEEGRQKRESEAKQTTDKRIRDTYEFAQKEIPNWTPDRDKAITDVVAAAGLTPEQVRDNISPAFYKLADLALDGHRYREAVAAKNKQSQAAPNVTPLRKVATRKSAGSAELSDNLPADDWLERRYKQLKQKTG